MIEAQLEDLVVQLVQRLDRLEETVESLRAEPGPPMPLLERQYRRASSRARDNEEG